jgi:hypothetical protein
VDQHFCIRGLTAHRTCLSRLPGKRAWPVLRGPGRSNASRLPDWKPPFYLLEAAGFETWLVNAKDVKHLPGRPKTDRLDAVWLCKVAERQMLRPSFVPPTPIRVLRDLTRYRVDQVAVRTAEKQRVEKLLEDAHLTELRGGVSVSCGEILRRVVSVPCHGRSSGCAAGSVVVGGAWSRVAGAD